MSEQVTIDLLKGFLEAFNLHDLDAIMSYFAEDCVFTCPEAPSRALIDMSGRWRFEQD